MEKETFIYSIESFNDLLNASWTGALDTLLVVRDNNKEDELLEYLNSMLSSYENGMEETQLNDHLWFDRDYIYDELGIEHD